jgi:hypothetical protein
VFCHFRTASLCHGPDKSLSGRRSALAGRFFVFEESW